MENVKLLVTVPGEAVNDMYALGLGAVLQFCKVEAYAEPKSVGEPIVHTPEIKSRPKMSMFKYRQEERKISRKMIKFVCDCGRLNFKVTNRNDIDGLFYIACHGCESLYTFADEQLVKYEYTCDVCGEKNWWYTTEDEALRIRTSSCKSCRSEFAIKEAEVVEYE